MPDTFTVQNGVSKACGIETEWNISASDQWGRCQFTGQKHTVRKNREALLVFDKDGVEVNDDKLRTDVYSQEKLMTWAAVV